MIPKCDGFGPFSSMVSPWYENGNVNVYLRKLGDAGTVERRLKLVSVVDEPRSYSDPLNSSPKQLPV